ncbi:MAG: hypothetical protein IPI67_09580 [Myxococcales bacterium]|nr:hypothetical protein [Myxococcales bacterium]
MNIHTLSISLSVAVLCIQGYAFAETPSRADAAQPPAKVTRPLRRAAKHDKLRSEAVRGSRVHVMTEVIVVGRPQRPLSVLETAAQPFRFPVGTARYSAPDRRFLPAEAHERW